MRILIVEDDTSLADVIQRGLVDHHYSVDVAADGSTAEMMVHDYDYDLILLDIMLPGRSGYDVCRNIRGEGVATPILMLTALDDVDSRIAGLDVGADDYLCKPFHLGELLARVRSLLRRSGEQRTTEITVANLTLDTAGRTVRRDGKPIKLTSKEFALLEYFVLNQGRVLTREMISEHVWDMNFDPQSNVIDSFVRFLRQKIDKDHSPQLIHTVRGSGYRFSVTE